jgi:hypothetical protein
LQSSPSGSKRDCYGQDSGCEGVGDVRAFLDPPSAVPVNHADVRIPETYSAYPGYRCGVGWLSLVERADARAAAP